MKKLTKSLLIAGGLATIGGVIAGLYKKSQDDSHQAFSEDEDEDEDDLFADVPERDALNDEDIFPEEASTNINKMKFSEDTMARYEEWRDAREKMLKQK